MENGNINLNMWHDCLSIYIVKTNKKFSHLQGLLDDITNSSDEEPIHQIKKPKKPPLVRDIMPQNNDDHNSKSQSFRNGTQIASMIKNQTGITSRDENNLDNTFNILDGPRILIENFTGKEFNVTFVIDEFFKYFILHNLNWALFFKK